MPLEFCHNALLLGAFSIENRGHASLAGSQTAIHEVDALFDLRIGLAFYQTKWFTLSLGILSVIVLWTAYRLRLRILTDQVRNLLAERLSERERISRELDDTLLQGMQGLILLFQGIAVQIPSETPLAAKLETAISRAERFMVQGRDGLRDLGMPNLNLADALRSLNAEQRRAGTDYSVEVNGRERELQLLVPDEVFKIAREAIVKALHHASADHVGVVLTYRRRSLDLIVVDDGRDVSSEVSEDGTSGLWGVSGMRGRARKLQGTLLISNRRPTGTEVRLSVPASVAYQARNLLVMDWLRGVRNFLRRREHGQ